MPQMKNTHLFKTVSDCMQSRCTAHSPGDSAPIHQAFDQATQKAPENRLQMNHFPAEPPLLPLKFIRITKRTGTPFKHAQTLDIRDDSGKSGEI